MSSSRPNLLFLMADHLRADSIGMTQAGVEVTPNLTRLAAAGLQFTRAYTTCPLCAPARTSLATSVYPTRHDITTNDFAGRRARDFKPIHQCLAEASYEIAHVGVHHVRLKPSLQERVAFAHWTSNEEYAQYADALGIERAPGGDLRPYRTKATEYAADGPQTRDFSNTKTVVWPHDAEQFLDLFFCRRAIEFLQRQRGGGRPFALFLCLWAPHPPLWVPEPYASMFDPARLDLPANVGRPAPGEPANRRRGISAQMAAGVPLEQWRRVWAAHLGLVRMADEGLGRVLRALDETGRADETIVLFTVDHGEQLGQHSMYQKMEMYEPALRVPLIVRAPGLAPRRIDTPVSHLDIMPSLLDALAVEKPAGLDGVSLTEAIASGAPLPERPVFAQYSGCYTIAGVRRAVVTRRFKYVFDPEASEELYDLQDDPLEMNNLASDPSHSAALSELREQCRGWADSHGDWVFDGARHV